MRSMKSVGQTTTVARTLQRHGSPSEEEFLPLDSACEEHTCTWSLAEGVHDLDTSNVHLTNANDLSIPSGRKVMVSCNVLGPGGRVVLHAQTLFVWCDVARPPFQCGAHEDWRRGQILQKGLMDRSAHRQRAPVWVKGKLSIQKTCAWIVLEADDAAPPNPPPAAPEPPAALG